MVSSPTVSELGELAGNSKTIAVVCFIIEEMVSRGRDSELCLADNENEPGMNSVSVLKYAKRTRK